MCHHCVYTVLQDARLSMQVTRILCETNTLSGVPVILLLPVLLHPAQKKQLIRLPITPFDAAVRPSTSARAMRSIDLEGSVCMEGVHWYRRAHHCDSWRFSETRLYLRWNSARSMRSGERVH